MKYGQDEVYGILWILALFGTYPIRGLSQGALVRDNLVSELGLSVS